MPSHATEVVKMKYIIAKRAFTTLLWSSWISRRSTVLQASSLNICPLRNFKGLKIFISKKCKEKIPAWKRNIPGTPRFGHSQSSRQKGLDWRRQTSFYVGKWKFGSPDSSSASLLAAVGTKGSGIAASRFQHLYHLRHSKPSRENGSLRSWSCQLALHTDSGLSSWAGWPVADHPHGFVMFSSTTGEDFEEWAVPKGKVLSLHVCGFLFCFLSYLSIFLKVNFHSGLLHQI